MNEPDKIANQELREAGKEIRIGNIYFDKKGEDIIRIIDIREVNYCKEPERAFLGYYYENLLSYEEDNWGNKWGSGSRSWYNFKDLSQYYRIDNPIKDLKALYESGKQVQETGIPKYEVVESFEKSTELVTMGSKENLMAMKESVEVLANQKKQLELILNYQLCEVKNKFELMRRELNNQLAIMQDQVKRIMRVIRVIELYLGIEEDLFQLQEGKEADVNEALTLRQQVLFMDEEVGILEDQGLDWTNINEFDEWLLKDKHYEILLPEKRSIVVFKPRRRAKRYYDAYDRASEDKDPRNKQPYFLIRNGENLYRISSDKMTVPERLFPKRKEFHELIEKMSTEDKLRSYDKSQVEDFTYYYQRIVFFIQGLIDRTDVFGADFKKVNLMKMEECGDRLRLIYDDELCLPTNRIPFKDWQKMLNEKVDVGSRVVWVPSIDDGYSCLKKDQQYRFLRYYNECNIPDLPNEGVYTVEKCIKKEYVWEEGYLSDSRRKVESLKELLCFKYNPGGSYYTWTECRDRKNNISFLINPKNELQMLNYDMISLDDVDFYLYNRTDRPNYLQYLPILKTIKKHLLEEQEQEGQFSLMLIGECQKRGLVPRDGLCYEDIIMELINWWKFKNKWKRPISKNDELAMKMIERRLFATSNKRLWFK